MLESQNKSWMKHNGIALNKLSISYQTRDTHQLTHPALTNMGLDIKILAHKLELHFTVLVTPALQNR